MQNRAIIHLFLLRFCEQPQVHIKQSIDLGVCRSETAPGFPFPSAPIGIGAGCPLQPLTRSGSTIQHIVQIRTNSSKKLGSCQLLATSCQRLKHEKVHVIPAEAGICFLLYIVEILRSRKRPACGLYKTQIHQSFTVRIIFSTAVFPMPRLLNQTCFNRIIVYIIQFLINYL